MYSEAVFTASTDILRTLVAHQILSSTRGVEGGYVLGRSAERISLLEIVEAIDGPIVPSLPSAEGLPGKTRQKLEAVLAEVADRTRLQLGAISLAALLPERPAATSERASFGTQRIADSARRIAVRGPQSRSAEPLAVTAKTI